MIHKCERSSLQASSCWDSEGAYIWCLFSLNFYDPLACWRWVWREIIYHWISSGTRGLLSGTFRGPGDFQLSTLPYRTWRLLSFEGTLDHVAAIRLKRANVTHLSERFLGHVFVIEQNRKNIKHNRFALLIEKDWVTKLNELHDIDLRCLLKLYAMRPKYVQERCFSN